MLVLDDVMAGRSAELDDEVIEREIIGQTGVPEAITKGRVW